MLCSDGVPGVPSAVSCLYRMALQLCKGGKVKIKIPQASLRHRGLNTLLLEYQIKNMF